MNESARHPFASLVSVLGIVFLIAGAALARPAGFYSAVHTAGSVVQSAGQAVFGHGQDSPSNGGGGRHQVTGQVTGGHTPADCQAVEATLSSTDGVPAGLLRSIQVVEANCEKNPQAAGLLTALGNLVVNAMKHTTTAAFAHGHGQDHALGPGQGQGQGQGHGQGHGQGQGQGHGGGQPAAKGHGNGLGHAGGSPQGGGGGQGS